MKTNNFFKVFFAAFALIVAVSACKPSEVISEEENEARNTFLKVSAPSFTIDGKVLAQYDEQNDQIVYNENKTEYMVSNLAFDKLYTLTLSGAPGQGAKVKVDCSTVGLDDINFTGREMTVLKADESNVWLWDPKDYIGVVMSFE